MTDTRSRFLRCDDAPFITGPNRVVDGGSYGRRLELLKPRDDRERRARPIGRDEPTLNSIESAKVIWDWGVN
jgi:hypothetical protein